jgi:hypothetical protein
MEKMSKIIDAQIIDAEDILADARDWLSRFFEGRSPEEIERIKDMLRAFPPPAPATRTKRERK